MPIALISKSGLEFLFFPFFFSESDSGARKDSFKGGFALNEIFQKGSLCIDLFPITVYRKCIKFGPGGRGGG